VSFLPSTRAARGAVGSLDRYRAQLLSGDKTAFAVESLLKARGIGRGTSVRRGTVSCVSACTAWPVRSGARFERLWPLLAELHPDGPMTDAVIRGLWTVDSGWGNGASRSRRIGELLLIGGQGLHHEIRRKWR